MEIKYESTHENIIDKCLSIISNPKIIVVDSQSHGYRKNRDLVDEKRVRRLLNSCVDDAAYYDELMK